MENVPMRVSVEEGRWARERGRERRLRGDRAATAGRARREGSAEPESDVVFAERFRCGTDVKRESWSPRGGAAVFAAPRREDVGDGEVAAPTRVSPTRSVRARRCLR